MTVCPRTGLGVPECSCPRCVEEQLRRFQPELLDRAAAEDGRARTRRRGRGDGRLAA